MSEFFCIFASDLRKRQFESELPLTLLLLYSYLPPATPFRGGCFVADLNQYSSTDHLHVI